MWCSGFHAGTPLVVSSGSSEHLEPERSELHFTDEKTEHRELQGLASMCRQRGKLEFVCFVAGVVLTHSGTFSILLASPGGPRTSPSPSRTVPALAQDLGLLH